MPMRGELSPPASRSPWSVNEDDLGCHEVWRQVGEAFDRLDPIILWFSGVGLLLSVCQAIFDPAFAEISAVLAEGF
jgi:hypothetical protein